MGAYTWATAGETAHWRTSVFDPLGTCRSSQSELDEHNRCDCAHYKYPDHVPLGHSHCQWVAAFGVHIVYKAQHPTASCDRDEREAESCDVTEGFGTIHQWSVIWREEDEGYVHGKEGDCECNPCDEVVRVIVQLQSELVLVILIRKCQDDEGERDDKHGAT